MKISAKSSFLQRFSGKIAYVTKHGNVTEGAVTQLRTQKKYSTEVPSQPGFNTGKRASDFCSGIQASKTSDWSLGRTIQRTQAGSFHTRWPVGEKTQQENKKAESRINRCETKQKLVNVAANLLSSSSGQKKSKAQKSSSLCWQMPDKETQDFYQQLTNLQQSKALAFGNNPRVHL